MQIYLRNCFVVEGIGNLEIASIFCFVGRIPSLIIKWPENFNSVFPNSDLVAYVNQTVKSCIRKDQLEWL